MDHIDRHLDAAARSRRRSPRLRTSRPSTSTACSAPGPARRSATICAGAGWRPAPCASLTQPGSSVLEVALAVGFGSGEAFARAFKSHFGATPSAWREERNPDQAERSPDQAERSLRSGARQRGLRSWVPATPEIEDTTMNTDVTLIDLPPTPIAYFRHTGPYGSPVARFWMERLAPWMAENELFGRERYGIAHDDLVHHRADEVPLRRLPWR